MRFQVPQFIEIEDKIFGPLTFKQFIYLVGGGGGAFVLWAIFPLYLAIIFGIPIVIFSLALAFYKVNNQPFIKIVESAFNYFTRNKLYLWRKDELRSRQSEMKKNQEIKKENREESLYAPKLTKNKLEDLAWSLDIKEKIGR